MTTRRPEADLRRAVDEIARLVERNRTLDEMAHRQATPNRSVVEQLQQRQNRVEVERRVGLLHPADFAFVLESLPIDDRELIWRDAEAGQASQALLELDPIVRDPLIAATERKRLIDLLSRLDLDDLASLSDAIPPRIFEEVMRARDELDQSLVSQTIAYPEQSVGQLMTRDAPAVRETQTVADVLHDLRARGTLPAQLDRLFVVDARNVLKGSLGFQTLLTVAPEADVASIMEADPMAFRPEEPGQHAAKAFERYDLLSAPVVNDRGKLVGRVTVDAVMDFVREEAERDTLAMAGLRGAEDLFASIWASARNRWPWLVVNLITAFAATRFIGLFESTIQDLVALATLMPIVASIGGNTGNQTVALVIRGFAVDQINPSSVWPVLRKELVVSVLNGLMWGGVVGLLAGGLYGHPRLGLVMAAAVLLNLIIAAAVGVYVPFTLERLHRDPAQGASVLLTFVTDSMGFFIFLGLARLFL
jgi:magnesium transporter